MKLAAEIALARGARAIDVALEVAAGETVALVGPNGAGKSTVLSAIAGLLRVEHGRIALGDETLDAGPAGPFVPAESRRVGLVFQDPLLFPHLSARENVAFGPRSRGARRSEARRVADTWLERVGLGEEEAELPPGRLSGGQAQRVALARALAADPRAILLDEPLAAVDASAKLDLRRMLRAHLTTFEGPRIVVAHEITDAIALADRIVVLESGRVVQSGRPLELVRLPASPYVADLVGLNGFLGRAEGHAVSVGEAELTIASRESGDVLVTVHPRGVSLYRGRPSGSPRNVWEARVEGVETLPDRARVRLGGKIPIVAEVTHAAVLELGLKPGVEVWAAVKATELQVTAQ